MPQLNIYFETEWQWFIHAFCDSNHEITQMQQERKE